MRCITANQHRDNSGADYLDDSDADYHDDSAASAASVDYHDDSIADYHDDSSADNTAARPYYYRPRAGLQRKQVGEATRS